MRLLTCVITDYIQVKSFCHICSLGKPESTGIQIDSKELNHPNHLLEPSLFQNNCAQPSSIMREAYRKMFDFFLRAMAEK